MSEQVSAVNENAAYEMSKHLCLGFKYHDERRREKAIDAFARVDKLQFQHISNRRARQASVAYVDALWEKDEVEDACRVDDVIDPELLDDADWSPVRDAFRERAHLAGIDPEYAELSTIAWRRHKTGGDYWTPIKRAQTYELRAALQDPEYPHKPRHGQSGFGPEAARYQLGVELHDMRRWEQACQIMVPYFERILEAHHG